MSFYLHILALSQPTDIGLDDNKRTMFSFNVEAKARGLVAVIENDILKLITDASLGVFGTDAFIGSASLTPDGDGPFVHIINTGGGSPNETHNLDIYPNLSCQILVRSLDYTAARARAYAIWAEVHGKRNVTIVAP